MKTVITAVALLLITNSVVDARQRQRVSVYPRERPIVAHPYGVELALSKMLCGFHLFSLGPNPRPGSVGSCASWFNYARPKRV